MTVGEYNVKDSIIHNVDIIQSPRPSNCEKNWIFIPEYSLVGNESAKNKMNFIYGWHPLQIGAVETSYSEKVSKKLEIHTTFNTPDIFSRFRGSSNMYEYDNRLWCLAHIVKYSTPRLYYHSLVGFNRHTMKPETYSLPFCFRKVAIEYCLAIHIKDGKICFAFSQNDSEPGIITMPLNNLRFLTIS